MVKTVKNEMNMILKKEDKNILLAKEIKQKLVVFSIVTVILLIVLTCFQNKRLTKFFKDKKMI